MRKTIEYRFTDQLLLQVSVMISLSVSTNKLHSSHYVITVAVLSSFRAIDLFSCIHLYTCTDVVMYTCCRVSKLKLFKSLHAHVDRKPTTAQGVRFICSH